MIITNNIKTKRKVTDIICLILFYICLFVFFFISYYAFANGDLNKL